MRIREIAEVRIRYGYRRIHVLLLREGRYINHKRVYRIYREEGLNLRRKAKKRLKSAKRIPSAVSPNAINECRAMDFVSDQFYNGKRFRTLTLIDLYSRECMALHADKKALQGKQWQEYWIRSDKTKGCLSESRRIKVRSLSPGLWMHGRTSTIFSWITRGREHRQITRLLNLSTEAFGMNA
jgi:transposase InsO family protein